MGARRGAIFINALDRDRLGLLCDFIWSFNFKKPELDVDICYGDVYSEKVQAKQTKVRYLIKVRPDTEISEIYELLIKKGYILG